MVYGGEIVYLMVLYQSKRSARRSQDEWCGLWHIGTHLFREYNHQWFSFPLSVLYGYGSITTAEKSNVVITYRKGTEYRKISP